jgi:hypothetical protein
MQIGSLVEWRNKCYAHKLLGGSMRVGTLVKYKYNPNHKYYGVVIEVKGEKSCIVQWIDLLYLQHEYVYELEVLCK